MWIRRLLGAAIILSLVVVSIHKVDGRGPRQQKPPTVATVSLTGTIETVTPGQLKIKASKDNQKRKKASDQEWLVGSQPAATLLVVGNAEVSYLRTGQVILFKAELDDKGQAKDKVSELTIVPAQGNKPGVAADDGKPLGHVADAGGDKAPPKRKGRGKGNKADADPNPAKDDAAPANTSIKKVTARIGKLAGNKLTVNPGGKAMQIELTDDATINIALTDPKLIVAGAMIKVHGQAIENNNGKVCNADDITVTLVSPLTGKRRPVRLETKPKPAAEQDDGAVPAAKENAKPDAEGDGQ